MYKISGIHACVLGVSLVSTALAAETTSGGTWPGDFKVDMHMFISSPDASVNPVIFGFLSAEFWTAVGALFIRLCG